MIISNRFKRIECKRNRELSMVLDEDGCDELQYILEKYITDNKAKETKTGMFAQYIVDILRG